MARMTPILYPANETAFAGLGICKLRDAVSCVVEEEYNTEFICTVELPENCNGYQSLKVGNLIVCRPDKYGDETEAFEIITTEATSASGTKVATCRQVALERMRHLIVGPVSKLDAKAPAVLAAVQNAIINKPGSNELQITLHSDVDIKNEFENTIPKTLYDIFFEDENGILAKFGGELKFHMGEIHLLASRGADRGQTVKYGRNMESMTVTVDQSEVVDGICAYYAKQISETNEVRLVTGTNKIVYAENRETAYPRIIPVDATSYILAPEGASNEWTPTAAQVEEWARLYVAINYSGIIPMTVSAGVVEDVMYGHTREMFMADTVRLYNPPMGINLTAKIVKTSYNCLSDTWNEISIGSVRANLAQTIVDMMRQQNKITTITTGGGNSGTEGDWSWNISGDAKSATIYFSKTITTDMARTASGYKYVEVSSAVPQYFKSGWTVNTSSISYQFTASDESSTSAKVYLRGYDSTEYSLTVWILGTGNINGTLTGSVRVTKNS